MPALLVMMALVAGVTLLGPACAKTDSQAGDGPGAIVDGSVVDARSGAEHGPKQMGDGAEPPAAEDGLSETGAEADPKKRERAPGDGDPRPDEGAPRDRLSLSCYVALGSSSTVGAGASDPPLTGYVGLLTARLRARYPALRMVNLGQGGATIGHHLSQLEEIERQRPELVTILPFSDYARTGTEELRRGFAKLLDELGKVGATVFLGDLRIDPKLVCGHGKGPTGLCYAEQEFLKLSEKNKVMAALAAARAHVQLVPVVDTNASHPEWIAADGAHPNDKGHSYLADRFWPSIEVWLRGR